MQATAETLRDQGPDVSIETEVWRLLAQAERIEDFGGAWIGLLSRAHDGIVRSALLLGMPDSGPYELVARFPEAELTREDPFPATTAHVLEAATRKRRAAIEGGGDLPTQIAYPLVFTNLLH